MMQRLGLILSQDIIQEGLKAKAIWRMERLARWDTLLSRISVEV